MAQRESEAKFRSAMESAIDAIIYADDQGRIRSWNSAATALFGHTEQEAMGRRLELIIPERFRDLHRAGIERVSAGGPTHAIGSTFEVAALRRDGGEFPVELSLATWFLGEDRYYTGIIRDISERKAAEEALRRSEQGLREKGEELRLKNAALEATLEQISQMQEQLILQEKMASLGKLSAGMAHELNNPASAAQRGASQAVAMFAKLQDAQLRLVRLGLDEPQLDRLRDLGLLAEQRAREPVVLDAVTRSDREADVEDWLEDHQVASAGELAPALVSLDYTPDALEELAAAFNRRRARRCGGVARPEVPDLQPALGGHGRHDPDRRARAGTEELHVPRPVPSPGSRSTPRPRGHPHHVERQAQGRRHRASRVRR